MNRRLLALCAVFALGSVAEAKVQVVATTSDLGVIAREIGAEDADVRILARPTEDPHFVDAKPSLVVLLARADLVLLTGMDMEIGWLPVLLTSSRNSHLQKGEPGYLDCSTLITPREVPTQKLDRSMGDIHPGGNPHYSKDPRNGIALAQGITARLAELDPAHADAFKGREKKFEADLQARIAQWEKQLAPLKGKPVVTYHKSWFYFTDWAGLEEVAFVEPKPGLPPSTGHVAKVLQIIQARKVPLIIQEDWYSPATSELLASHGPSRLVRIPGMPGEKQRYADYIGALVDAIAPRP